jgi:hypothetical protein
MPEDNPLKKFQTIRRQNYPIIASQLAKKYRLSRVVMFFY